MHLGSGHTLRGGGAATKREGEVNEVLPLKKKGGGGAEQVLG